MMRVSGTALRVIPAVIALTLMSTGVGNAATALSKERSVKAVVTGLERALPDPQFYEPAQHKVSVAEVIASTRFNIPNREIEVAGSYIGQEITRGSEKACILPDPLRVEQRWIVVTGGCEAYFSKNASKIAKTRNLAIVTYASATIAKNARIVANGGSVKFSDLVTAATGELPIDYRIVVGKSSVVLSSDGTPTASATLTVSSGKVRVRIR